MKFKMLTVALLAMSSAIFLPSYASASEQQDQTHTQHQKEKTQTVKNTPAVNDDTSSTLKQESEIIKKAESNQDKPVAKKSDISDLKVNKVWTLNQNMMSYSDLIDNIKAKNVKKVIFSSDLSEYSLVLIEMKDGEKFSSNIVFRSNFDNIVENPEYNIQIDVVDSLKNFVMSQYINHQTKMERFKSQAIYYSISAISWVLGVLGTMLQMIVVFGVVYYLIFKIMSKGSSGDEGGKVDPEDIDVGFDDVIGNASAKKDIEEVISFFKDDEKFKKFGLTMPSGVLLTGLPGNGKTMFAKAIAKECNATFFSASGSEFEEVFAGLGAKRVRSLFKKARKEKKAVIFIDEIDAVAKKRGGMNNYHEQTLNQILAEMDGFNSVNDDCKVLVVAATNRIEVLDEAILRPGRFDRKLVINKPLKEDRILIAKSYIEKAIKKSDGELSVDEKFDYEALGRLTSGFSGAEMKNIVDETLLLMVRDNKSILNNELFSTAKDKVLLGNRRTDIKMIEKEKKITAYHEIGHAVASLLLSTKESERTVEGVNIIPHEKSLGVTYSTEETDPILRSKQDILNDIIVLVAGRAAEDVFIGSVSTGASNDLERANLLAYEMLAVYGMSEDMPFLNISGYADRVSETTKHHIEKQISTILRDNYSFIKGKFEEMKEIFIDISEILIDREEIGKEEFYKVLETYNFAQFNPHYKAAEKQEEIEA